MSHPPTLQPLDPFETFDARKESRKSLLGFSLVYLTGYFTDPPALFHPQLVSALESESDRRVLVLGFRGSGKSTFGSLALPLWAALEYASMNAIAREVMTIDWRLFQVSGKNHKEQTEHEVLDLLDTVNDSMISLSFKYLLSACLTLTGNSFVYLQGVSGDLDKPKAIHLMPPDKVKPVIDRRSWPFQLVGYRMKLENYEMAFQPHEVIHLQLPSDATARRRRKKTHQGARRGISLLPKTQNQIAPRRKYSFSIHSRG